jgi:hypothetical protein
VRWHAGARGRRCSSAVVEEDEEDEAEQVRGLPEPERWWGGGAMVAEYGGSLSSEQE